MNECHGMTADVLAARISEEVHQTNQMVSDMIGRLVDGLIAENLMHRLPLDTAQALQAQDRIRQRLDDLSSVIDSLGFAIRNVALKDDQCEAIAWAAKLEELRWSLRGTEVEPAEEDSIELF